MTSSNILPTTGIYPIIKKKFGSTGRINTRLTLCLGHVMDFAYSIFLRIEMKQFSVFLVRFTFFPLMASANNDNRQPVYAKSKLRFHN